MGVTIVVGANWGDEGKGKLVDNLAAQSDYVVRFQGGSNAGHTVINQLGRFALHLLPSGVFYPHVINVLGPGVAVNIGTFLKEYAELTEAGVPRPKLYISERAQVVLPYHILFDELEEERLTDQRFGSTKSGIAPFYSDKYLKIGVQVADLFSEKTLAARITGALAGKNVLLKGLYHRRPLDAEAVLAELAPLIPRLRPFVADTTSMLRTALGQGKKIILEGQLGALRDPDHGIYPFTTSSSTLAGFATVGAGIPATGIDRIIAVVKAYSSCIGAGPFVTELFGPQGDELRNRGGSMGEFGATTGRPRRMGWLDMVATKYGCQVQGATEIALTLLDVLGYLDTIPVCTGYKIEGKVRDVFPVTRDLNRAKPIYEYLPGWKSDISHVRNFEELPPEARAYVAYIEKQVGLPIRYISVGPHRDHLIIR